MAGALAGLPLGVPAATLVIPPLLAVLRPLADGPAWLGPLPVAWVLSLLAGALAGGLAGLGVVWAVWRVTREETAAPADPAGGTARTPARSAAWLHVVSGPGPHQVARAAAEIGASRLARGERVLVLDGGRRLRLHEWFGCEPHWGLVECLTGELPVLGLVQNAGAPGFYLLAHGNSARGEAWSRLGRLLDEVRPYFGRVVLALEASAPHAAGEGLRGRELDGWWAVSGPGLPRLAFALSERLGIPFSGIELATEPQDSLEVEAAVPGPVTPAARPPQEPAPAPAGVRAPEPCLPAAVAPVLECELQVRERLRFLMWMRRIQAESRRAALQSLERPEPARAL